MSASSGILCTPAANYESLYDPKMVWVRNNKEGDAFIRYFLNLMNDGVQQEAKLNEEAHTEAFHQAIDESEVELANIRSTFEDDFELKYADGYDRRYVTCCVRWDHHDG
ncbi:hypothetical protein C1H46_015478 [Malus baccata]|uniref:Uncharacterized protein n=1 Tax=Malus baccata TaxID=106549 RepID=A0A540MJ77_MALBA|nr:hypothetical protein C1H46_015478 [Malus baccata]